MSVQAVGAYIQGLIERHGLTIAAVTAEAGVKPNYLWRLLHAENGNPSALSIARLVRAARGDYDVAMALLLDDEAGEEAGTAAAHQPTDDAALLARLSPAQRQLLTELARELLHEREVR
jgi:transcriptional regulator with XRE-family HTH domain